MVKTLVILLLATLWISSLAQNKSKSTANCLATIVKADSAKLDSARTDTIKLTAIWQGR